jgi:hypothetical protein
VAGLNECERWTVRVLSLLDVIEHWPAWIGDDPLPLPRSGMDDQDRERVARAVCKTVGMTMERWDKLKRKPDAQVPHLKETVRRLENRVAKLLPRVTRPQSRRPRYDRDHLWLKWASEEGLKPAAIRDRWNREHRQHGGERIGSGRSGIDVVKKGLAKARVES